MLHPQNVLYEGEYQRIQRSVDELVRLANARVVFVVDKAGQQIAAGGEIDEIDTTSLASLTAGNIAATGGIAKLLRENEFTTQFHEGKNAHIYIQLVGNRVILVVIYDVRSNLGLVRLRAAKTTKELSEIFESMNNRPIDAATGSPFSEITDEDIDSLFND